MSNKNKEVNSFLSRKRTQDKLSNAERLIQQQARELLLLKDQLVILDKSGREIDVSRPFDVKVDRRLKTEIVPICLLSDGHVEEKVTKASTNGLNEYSPIIARKRIENFFINSLKIIKKERLNSNSTINTVVLAILGDMISGYIHEELMESNYLSPIEAIMLAQELITSGLMYWSDNGEFKTIKVVCKMGNHSRLSKKKKYSTGYKNSLEYLMYHNIIKHFNSLPKYNNIEFLLEDNNISYLKVFDYTIRFSHGDHFNYRGGVGGVEIPFKTWLYKQNQSIHADLTCIGHFHRHCIVGDGIINSSIKGYDAFAAEHAFGYQAPTQQMQFIDRDRGLTTNYKIFLD